MGAGLRNLRALRCSTSLYADCSTRFQVRRLPPSGPQLDSIANVRVLRCWSQWPPVRLQPDYRFQSHWTDRQLCVCSLQKDGTERWCVIRLQFSVPLRLDGTIPLLAQFGRITTHDRSKPVRYHLASRGLPFVIEAKGCPHQNALVTPIIAPLCQASPNSGAAPKAEMPSSTGPTGRP